MGFNTLLLVVPPQLFLMEGFRTALIALASYEKRKLPNVDIRLLDLSSADRQEIRNLLQNALRGSHGPVLAGISTVTADYQSALAVAKELKALDREIVTVMGGHHASADAAVVLQAHLDVNYVISGEGEIPLYHLIKSHLGIEQIPGLAFRTSRGVIRNALPQLLQEKDLDLVPVQYDGWELTKTPGKFDHVTYVSARGCPLHCAFCAVANQAIRGKSPSQVEKDVQELVEMKFTKLAFEDNFFAHSVKRTTEVCEALTRLQSRGLEFSWDCQTRVESTVRSGIASLMKRAGCDAVYLGVESLDEESLLFLGKTTNPVRYLSQLEDRAVPSLLEQGIDCFINLQFGLPNENNRQIDKALQRMARLGKVALKNGAKITVYPQLFVVYPGTFHFLQFSRSKLFAEDIFEDFTAWEAEQKPILSWLGKTFAHGTGGLPLGILDSERLRDGKFTVDGTSTARVVETIERLGELDGIRVFHYGQYLVKGDLQ